MTTASGGKRINTLQARLNAVDVYSETALWGLCVSSRPSLTADELAHRW
ncbi:MAG: hypothetical protein JWM36_4874, partial [Hyphomicrobiales bacterium]|nr:hypothetical protein [Hyphomicrobiales bacterium]